MNGAVAPHETPHPGPRCLYETAGQRLRPARLAHPHFARPPLAIGRITGTLLEKNPPQILVDAHGVGYEIDVPMSTFYNLPATGGTVSLHTHFVVREDGHFLFGFATEEERATFRQLLKGLRVGAHGAAGAVRAVVERPRPGGGAAGGGRLVKIPGIGKKTAERLLLELRDNQGAAQHGGRATRCGGAPGAAPDAKATSQRLLALGYNEREACPR